MPHVRVHVPERALTSWLLLDVSPSMAFGTADRRKTDVAEGVAIADRPPVDAARQPARRPDLRRPRPTASRGRSAGRAGLLDDARPPSSSRPTAARRGFKSPESALRFVAHGAPAGGPRGPGLGPPRAARLAARSSAPSPSATACSSSRSAIRARTSCPTSASSTSSTPRRGATVRVDTSSPTLRDPVRRGRRPRSRPRRPRAPAPARPPRRPVHVRQLAALARRPAPHPGNGVHDLRVARAPARPPARADRARAVPAGPAAAREVRRPVHERRPADQPRAATAPRWRRHVPTALYLAAIAALAHRARPAVRRRSTSPARRRR